ncbi:MAG: hypothetical protein ACYDEE_14185 [Ignavibacteriaceae bacterium]
MSSKVMKERIIKDIDKLPDDSLKEIKDFVSFILSKSGSKGKKKRNYSSRVIQDGVHKRQKKTTLLVEDSMGASRPAYRSGRLDPSKDPLLKYIGSIEHGSLAREIDKELYGEID